MTEKPQAKPVDIGYLPDTLCKTAKFCNWRYEWVDDRWTKVPCSPGTGRHIDATDPVVYETLDDALETKHEHDGIGVGIFDNLAGIDIDHCVDEDGHLSELAQDIVDTMDAYTEKSPSGTGLRILFTVPDGFDYAAKTEYYVNNRKNGVEVYVAGKTKRFLTVTGDTLTEGRDLRERGDQLHVVLDKYMKKAQPKKNEAAQPVKTTAEAAPDTPVDITDEDLFDMMETDAHFRELWTGITSNYGSQSEADLALCNDLAYWTGRDPDRIDKFFRMSGLYRDKWDRDDYRTATIEKAIAGCTSVYTPDRKAQPKKAGPLPRVSVAKYLESGGMEADLDYFRKYQDRKTGFVNIDRHLTLYPGLCVFGGAASIGKTTFCVNLADNLVKFGETVLYISLEQEMIEIVSKSLARKLAERDPATQIRNTDIKNGVKSDQLDAARREYVEAVADKFYILRGSFRTTAAQIRDTVVDFIKETGVRPVVVIDYLQLISPPEDFKGDTRVAIDDNIKLLKTMQVENELFVVLVSSFNRSSYDVPITFESFKESGLIEYTSDFLMGLQLSILSEDRFYYRIGSQGGKIKTTEIERSDMIDAAMKEYPKKVQLVSLKNRNGPQRFRCNFAYYNDLDYFVDTDTDNPYEDQELDFN